MAASDVPILFASAMLAQETIEYAAVLRPDKKIFKYLFLRLDIILGKLLASAGRIPLLKIWVFPDGSSNGTQNTEHPWIVPALMFASQLYKPCSLFDLLGTITD